ncbi:uncharacterized protein TA05160 [Theileria annulata]|uniref:Major Facilitator Superfamily n=1 Tax=Theileria annulata TaxID=5874 RepID=Q4UBN5_THEAN|nr:uncharacterized protein TA05160 [Theileria annulata]CAI75766.1 hypothetical protein, conserved [Theileria annulata]|eukprot:XP_955242.1 hypothetical protein, conserved [Theileria annulata]
MTKEEDKNDKSDDGKDETEVKDVEIVVNSQTTEDKVVTPEDNTEEKKSRNKFKIKAVDPRQYTGPYINPWIRLVIYVVMIYFSGTLYLAWPGFQTLLYKAGAFEELCIGESDISKVSIGGDDYIDCGSRKAALNNLYTIAFSTHFLSTFLTGIVFDLIGPKYLYMISQLIQMITWVLIGSFPKKGVVLRIAFFLVGLSAESSIMPLMTISYYFPHYQSFIISIIGATRSLSFINPIMLSKIFENKIFSGKHLYIITLVYTVISNLTSFVMAAFILQKRFYKVTKSKHGSQLKYITSANITSGHSLSFFERFSSSHLSRTFDGEKTSLGKRTLMDITNRVYLLVTHPQFLEYVILVLVSSLYLSSVEFVSKSQRELLLCSDGSSAVDLFKYIHILTFAPCPFMGYLVDKIGPTFVLIILHSCCFFYYFFVSFDYYFLKILACIFYLFACSMFISHIYCYVTKRFNLKNFGRLVGFCFFSAGLFVIINVPLYNFMTKRSSTLDKQNIKIVTRIFIGYMGTGFVMCLILLYFTSKRKRPKHKQAQAQS